LCFACGGFWLADLRPDKQMHQVQACDDAHRAVRVDDHDAVDAVLALRARVKG
jgi:hypothetical protein